MTRSDRFLLASALVSFVAACSSPHTGVQDAGRDTSTAADAATDHGADGDADQADDAVPDGAGGDTGGQVDAGGPVTTPIAYEVHGSLVLTPVGGTTGNPPGQQDFTLFLDPQGMTAVLGGGGGLQEFALTSTDGRTFVATENVSVRLSGQPCSSSTVYPSFQFQASSSGVSGTASGSAVLISGDVAYSFNAALTFTGTLDMTPPLVSLTGGITAEPRIDPLARVVLKASEPLVAAGTIASLQGPADVVPLAPLGVVGPAFDALATPEDTALRYATTYSISIEPFQDLAGNTGTAGGQLKTMPAPPLIGEDGFETATGTVGGATIVDATVLPPIAGARSVAIGAFSVVGGAPLGIGTPRMTVRLPVGAGDTVVRLSLRPFSMSPSAGTFGVSLRVAAPGGGITSATFPASESTPTQFASPSGNYTGYLGVARAIELPLPPGTSSEVVVDFSLPPGDASCGLSAPPPGYLVDDLRVE